MTRIRKDVAKLGDGWNDTLVWYAKAVRALNDRPINDRTSWRFLAAIHGFDEEKWRTAGLFRPGETAPSELEGDTFGNQCQHANWYFLPWHRGYLAAFESIVAATIKDMGGPDHWALPYWNYLDSSNPDARRTPEPFLDPDIPEDDDDDGNPLSKAPRRTPPVLAPFSPRVRDINLKAMEEPDFLVGRDLTIGFGGGVTTFSNFGGVAGDLEANPHNSVHVMLGGLAAPMGYMSDPDFAALDPIFWLHHCNIDRLWEAWMNAPGRTMVRDPRWLDGPLDRRFVMPRPDGTELRFVPRDTLRGGSLHPTYDDLSIGTGVAPAPADPRVVGMGMGSKRSQSVEVIGATGESISVGAESATTTVPLDPGPATDSVRAMGPIEVGKEVTRLYLHLENVTGAAPSAVIDVFVNRPDQAADDSRYRADTLYLFGLDKASAPDRSHAGAGLGFSIDITELAQRLSEAGEFSPQGIAVSIVPVGVSPGDRPVTVGRLSVLRRRVRAEE